MALWRLRRRGYSLFGRLDLHTQVHADRNKAAVDVDDLTHRLDQVARAAGRGQSRATTYSCAQEDHLSDVGRSEGGQRDLVVVAALVDVDRIAWINAGITMIPVTIVCSALPTPNLVPRAFISLFSKSCTATSIGDSCASVSAVGIAGSESIGERTGC